MQRLIFLLFCFLPVSCSLPVEKHINLSPGPEVTESTLMNIRVERWGRVKFSGLLGLGKRDAGLQYVLLDATGVKLLAGTIKYNGAAPLPGGVLQGTMTANFLHTAFTRVFIIEPAQKPCSGSWFLRLCSRRKNGGDGEKSLRSAFMTLWRVDMPQGTEDGDITMIYSQPWLGIRIVLTGIRHGVDDGHG